MGSFASLASALFAFFSNIGSFILSPELNSACVAAESIIWAVGYESFAAVGTIARTSPPTLVEHEHHSQLVRHSAVDVCRGEGTLGFGFGHRAEVIYQNGQSVIRGKT